MRECASSGWRSQMLMGPLHCACLHCTHLPSQLACIYLYITRRPPAKAVQCMPATLAQTSCRAVNACHWVLQYKLLI